MNIAALELQQSWVLAAVFAVASAFGFIAQRTHFCTMGAVSDIVNMGSWTRMRMWAAAVAVAMIGFHTMAWLGWIDPMQTIYASGRVMWLSAVVGGLLFGFGMVLASGCGSKTLVRIGSGSLKSLTVFFVMGFAAYATLSGVLAVLRVNTVDAVAFSMPGGAALPVWMSHVLGRDAGSVGLWMGWSAGLLLLGWALRSEAFRTPGNLLGGLGLGVCIALVWWITGHLGFVPEHPETLEAVYLATDTGRMESLSFTAPMAYTLDWIILFSDRSNVLTTGVVAVAGVILGSAVQSWLDKSLRWEGFHGTQDTALHLVGAACMGVGGVTALGCTVGQGLSGLSTLSVTSFIAVAAIMAGAVAGLRFQLWLLERP
ncbi:MAG: YeeE/YedE family protein [Hydrogenophaga sp.]